MKDFYELASARQSCRKFDGRPVEKDILLKIIETARLAPSAMNTQPWRFIVVSDEKMKTKLANHMQHFNHDAGALIVIVEDRKNIVNIQGVKIEDPDYSQIDIGIVTSYIALAATDLGLANCIVGWFDEKEMKSLLHIDIKKRVRTIVTVGYSKENQKREKERQSLSDVSDFI